MPSSMDDSDEQRTVCGMGLYFCPVCGMGLYFCPRRADGGAGALVVFCPAPMNSFIVYCLVAEMWMDSIMRGARDPMSTRRWILFGFVPVAAAALRRNWTCML